MMFVSFEIARVKSRIDRLRVISVSSGIVLGGMSARIVGNLTYASAELIALVMSASRRFSVSNCCMRCVRLVSSVMRMFISCCRVVAFDSSRFDTLVQAISSRIVIVLNSI